MKSTIYNAPEGFFENFEANIKDRTAEIRTRRRILKAGILSAAAAVVVILSFGWNTGNGGMNDMEAQAISLEEDDEMLALYEYDIFLNTYQL